MIPFDVKSTSIALICLMFLTVNNYRSKQWIPAKIAACSLTGSYTHFTRTEIKPSSISTFLLVISETFFRKTGMWPKTSPPTTVYTDSIDNIGAFPLKALMTSPISSPFPCSPLMILSAHENGLDTSLPLHRLHWQETGRMLVRKKYHCHWKSYYKNTQE